MRNVVLVTGSSRGIGRATILEFASKGYDVVINYHQHEQEAYTLQEEVETKYGVNALVVQADVGKEEEVQKLVQKTIDTFGKIDVLVNNAGIAIDKPLEERQVKDWVDTLNTNLLGEYLVAKYVGKEMMKQKKGSIINISSTNGMNTFFPSSIDYDASKAGVISLTHNLALAYAPYIRVNSVAPGWVDTDMNKDLPETIIAYESEKIYLKRFAQPEEIAHVIFFLASDDASYINGEVIKVDGGY